MTVNIGNLQPGDTCKLKVEIVSTLDIVGGYYAFSLPIAFFQNYDKHCESENITKSFQYGFSYQARILAPTGVKGLSLPKGAEIAEQNEKNTDILICLG